MLEIILVVFLCQKVGTMVGDKGHGKGLYYFLIVIAWFGGEFAGPFAQAWHTDWPTRDRKCRC